MGCCNGGISKQVVIANSLLLLSTYETCDYGLRAVAHPVLYERVYRIRHDMQSTLPFRVFQPRQIDMCQVMPISAMLGFQQT